MFWGALRSENGALRTDRPSLRIGRSSPPPTTGFPIRFRSVPWLCACLHWPVQIPSTGSVTLPSKGPTLVNIAVGPCVRDAVHRVVGSVCLLPNQSGKGTPHIGTDDIYRYFQDEPRSKRTEKAGSSSVSLLPSRTGRQRRYSCSERSVYCGYRCGAIFPGQPRGLAPAGELSANYPDELGPPPAGNADRRIETKEQRSGQCAPVRKEDR